MDSEKLDAPGSPTDSPEREVAHEAEPAIREGHSPSEARALVAQLEAAGEWPKPELLEQILAAGDAAVEPLVAMLRAGPRHWPESDSLSHAIGLLGVLRRPETIPDLVMVLQEYEMEQAVAAAEALREFGTPGFNALINLCSNPSITGYKLFEALNAAADAAGDDPAQRSRLGEIARPMLDQAIARPGKNLKRRGFSRKSHPTPNRSMTSIATMRSLVSTSWKTKTPPPILTPRKSRSPPDSKTTSIQVKKMPKTSTGKITTTKKMRTKTKSLSLSRPRRVAHIVCALAVTADPLATTRS